jgi:hypothetical protein
MLYGELKILCRLTAVIAPQFKKRWITAELKKILITTMAAISLKCIEYSFRQIIFSP